MVANTKDRKNKVSPKSEVGVSGIHISSGYVFDEFQRELQGVRGRKKFREMADNDPICGAMIFAIESLIKAVPWEFESAPADTTGEKALWMKDTLENVGGMTMDDIVGECVSMIVFGFAVLEIVTGKKADGTIGLSKLAPRAQETILEWDFDESGEAIGLWQQPPTGGQQLYIPLWKCLHLTTKFNRGNPEGRSMLRNAYKPYHFIDVLSISEAIGAERNLAGLPVMYAPSDTLSDPIKKASMENLVRDIRKNEQGGLVIPSDPYVDSDGKMTTVRQFEAKLLSSEGSSTIDTDKIILRHKQDMARTLLADFLLLGATSAGSFALSSNKTELFVRAVEAILKNVAQSIDRQITPLLWMLNGWEYDTMPKATPGRVAPVNLQELGDFVAKLSGAGISLVDRETEDYLRGVSGLPPVNDENLIGYGDS